MRYILMKRTFFCAALAALFMLSGCAGSALHRGMDAASGAFVSTAQPVVSVQPAEGFAPVASGKTLCRVPYENSLSSGILTEVWYSLSKKEGAQLAVILAECPADWEWSLGTLGTEFQHLPVLYELNGDGVNDATVRAYVRPAGRDPWQAAFADGWQGDTLLARYEWGTSSSPVKLIVEYREPAPEELGEGILQARAVNPFLKRAQAAFALSGVQTPVTLAPSAAVSVSDFKLAPVIGPVSLPLKFQMF